MTLVSTKNSTVFLLHIKCQPGLLKGSFGVPAWSAGQCLLALSFFISLDHLLSRVVVEICHFYPFGGIMRTCSLSVYLCVLMAH